MKPSIFLNGTVAKATMLVTGVKGGETVKGDPYFHMTLVAEGGKEKIAAVCWAPLSTLIKPISGTIMAIEGTLSVYQGSEQIVLSSFTSPTTPVPADRFVSYDAEKAWNTYTQMLSLLENPYSDSAKMYPAEIGIGKYFVEILQSVMDDKLLPIFLAGRGGMKLHHSNAGDLVGHSLSVMKQAQAMAMEGASATGVPLNLHVLLLAAALHDVGKVYAYDFLTGDITPMEQLVGHISLGNALVMQGMQKMGVPLELQMQISHCILAHHGNKEWGSPVEPKTREALLLHLADMADSRLSQIAEQIQTQETEKGQFFGPKGYAFYNPVPLQESLPHEVAYPKAHKSTKQSMKS